MSRLPSHSHIRLISDMYCLQAVLTELLFKVDDKMFPNVDSRLNMVPLSMTGVVYEPQGLLPISTRVGGAMGNALDLRPTSPAFKSYSGQKVRNNLGQVVHTYHVPLSPSSITVPTKER